MKQLEEREVRQLIKLAMGSQTIWRRDAWSAVVLLAMVGALVAWAIPLDRSAVVPMLLFAGVLANIGRLEEQWRLRRQIRRRLRELDAESLVDWESFCEEEIAQSLEAK